MTKSRNVYPGVSGVKFIILGLSISLLVSMGITDVEAYGARRGHHGHGHGHGPRISVIAGRYYPPYPYYYSPAPRPVVEPTTATAPERLYVYPQRGQNNEEQSRDEYECHRWAVNQSGFDPVGGGGTTTVTHVAHGASGLPGDPITGTVGGAALGAAGGALAGDAGTGAAVGAAVGLVAGMIGQANEQRATVTRSPASGVEGGGAEYRRAFSTCLSARGYQVG